MSNEIVTTADQRMARAVEAMERDFQGLRTGRASTSLVERIHVDFYGIETPLNQLAGISVPDAHQIVIQPWDRSVLGAIEKAILKSDIGLMPNVDGTVVRLNIPALTEERRLALEALRPGDDTTLPPAFTDSEWQAIKAMCGDTPAASASASDNNDAPATSPSPASGPSPVERRHDKQQHGK